MAHVQGVPFWPLLSLLSHPAPGRRQHAHASGPPRCASLHCRSSQPRATRWQSRWPCCKGSTRSSIACTCRPRQAEPMSTRPLRLPHAFKGLAVPYVGPGAPRASLGKRLPTLLRRGCDEAAYLEQCACVSGKSAGPCQTCEVCVRVIVTVCLCLRVEHK